MRRASARAALALGAAFALCTAPAARGEQPAPEDPPLCREALATQPERSALAALAQAEQGAAARARRLRAEARKILRGNIGAGAQGGLAASDAAEARLHEAADLRRAGKVLCHCRQRRGDPDRSDCEFLYPEPLP